MKRRLLRLGLAGWLILAGLLLATGAGGWYLLRHEGQTPRRATLVRQAEFQQADQVRAAYLPLAARD
jgi:UPF0716 family protein affecting phage T7 exclusion